MNRPSGPVCVAAIWRPFASSRTRSSAPAQPDGRMRASGASQSGSSVVSVSGAASSVAADAPSVNAGETASAAPTAPNRSPAATSTRVVVRRI